MRVIRQLAALLNRRERLQVLGLCAVMIVMAVLETLGVASVMPFMELASDPGRVREGHFLTPLYEGLSAPSPEQFLLYVGIGLLAVIAANNAFSALTIWLIYRFAWSQNHRLSKRLLARYLSQPYEFFLPRNTASLGKNVLQEVQSVVHGVLLAALRMAARAIVIVLILALLAWIDVRLTLIAAGVLGGAYGLVYLMLRRKQESLGQSRLQENGARFRVAQEALGGIKTVKALGRESAFLERFQRPSWRYSQATASNQVASRLPRYAMETVAFGGVVVILLYHLRVVGNVAQVLPVLSLFAFAAYRLMPAFNELFAAGVRVRFNTAALEELPADLGEVDAPGVAGAIDSGRDPNEIVAFTEGIELENVSYRYPGSESFAVEDISLTIPRHANVAFVGETGCGKTTLVDLILGLLQVTSGSMEVDGHRLDEVSVSSWRRACGYVPQDVFLADDNIAFGVPVAEQDPNRVVKAARMARIHEFVESLPASYETLVGERGVRLSGGQRQRIGIARALYHEPEVLVLDEATNSLDGATEQAVMDTIRRLAGRKTLVTVAHRLSTVRGCDTIYLLESGQLAASGSYGELVAGSERFREVAGLERAGRG